MGDIQLYASISTAVSFTRSMRQWWVQRNKYNGLLSLDLFGSCFLVKMYTELCLSWLLFWAMDNVFSSILKCTLNYKFDNLILKPQVTCLKLLQRSYTKVEVAGMVDVENKLNT